MSQPLESAAKRSEMAMAVAEASAALYVERITLGHVGVARSVTPRQAFIDGFMTAIESLLTMDKQPRATSRTYGEAGK